MLAAVAMLSRDGSHNSLLISPIEYLSNASAFLSHLQWSNINPPSWFSLMLQGSSSRTCSFLGLAETFYSYITELWATECVIMELVGQYVIYSERKWKNFLAEIIHLYISSKLQQSQVAHLIHRF